MAIAPSKLGQYVDPLLYVADEARVRSLRTAGLVRPDTLDDDLTAAFSEAIGGARHDARGRARIQLPGGAGSGLS